MPIRATLTAVAATAAACLLLAPAALASSQSSHQSVQVTGKQLKSALLPASDFVAGYVTSNVTDSGGGLEHQTVFKVSSMKCSSFWLFIGTVQGFGESAFAGDLVEDKSGKAAVQEVFTQSVYQFASTHAAASFYSQVNAKYRSCRSITESDSSGTVRYTVHSQSKQRVGSHQALRLIQYATFPKTSLPPVVTYVLWTIDGTNIYVIGTILASVKSPQPTQSSLTLKLISRVGALR
jgi:PknH-like extracellular domain